MRKVFKSKSFLKTTSWLGISAVIIGLPTLAATGSLLTASEVAFWACLFKTPVYWLHELAWHRSQRKAHDGPVSQPRLCPACRAA